MTDEAVRLTTRGYGAWVFAVVALGVVVLGVVFSSRFGSDPELVPSPLIGLPAPAVELPFLEAEGTFDLGDLRGDITVVNFWASWCLGCRTEHPGLLAAAETFRDFDVRFVGILHQDNATAGIRFLDDLGRGDPFLYLDDAGSRAALEYGVLGLPETFFVDADGTIVGKISGPAPAGLLAATVQRLVLGEAIGTITSGEVENRD
ncbi:MAG: TlpA family protein disulfide reductase [Acidimicrobiia bacterium]